MELKIPHKKFIEALSLSGLTVNQVKKKLEELDLITSDEGIAFIYSTVQQSAKRNVIATTHNSTLRPIYLDVLESDLDVLEMFVYLTKHQIDRPFYPVDNSIKILTDPLMYRLITSMAFTQFTDEDIELIVNARFNYEYSSEDIKLFLKYFFNIESWSRKDKKDLVDLIEDPGLSYYYTLALKGDKEFLMWKLGVTPEKDFKVMLQEMAQDSFFNFKEKSKIKPDEAQRWANLTLKITDKIEAIQKEESGSTKGLLEEIQFKVKTYSAGPETIRHFSDVSKKND